MGWHRPGKLGAGERSRRRDSGSRRGLRHGRIIGPPRPILRTRGRGGALESHFRESACRCEPARPPSTLETLSDPRLLALVEGFEPGLDPLQVRRRLAADVGPELARTVAEQVHLRGRARSKFACSTGLLLTPKGLEQATPLPIARRRAAALAARLGPGAWVVDATAGLGAETLALAAAGLQPVAAEPDTATALCLAQNLRAHGLPVRVVRARLQDGVVAAPHLVVDPDRRDSSGARRGDPERWSPPFSAVLAALVRHRSAVVKLAPGVDVEPLLAAAGARGPASAEWVSWRGELKEATLWCGEAAGPVTRRAVALSRGGEAVLAGEADPAHEPAPLTPAEAAAVAWLAEPDPAVLRAGLFGPLAAQAGARPVGPGIAYLGSHERPEAPLLSAFRVLGSAPADRRRVRALLAAHDVGPLTVKRRGHPLDAEALARRLRGPGRRHGLLVVARLAAGHHAWLVERGPCP